MALDGRGRKVAAVVGVYLVGLIAVQQYYYWTEEPEQTEWRAQEHARGVKEWDDAKEAVNAECSQLSAASLDCQNSLQRRGVHQQVAMQQCQSSVEAYKQCKARKTRIESRRGWFEIQREKMKQQQQATGNT